MARDSLPRAEVLIGELEAKITALWTLLDDVEESLSGILSGVEDGPVAHDCSGRTCSICGWQSLAAIVADTLRAIEGADGERPTTAPGSAPKNQGQIGAVEPQD